jgi:hypothetical protein
MIHCLGGWNACSRGHRGPPDSKQRRKGKGSGKGTAGGDLLLGKPGTTFLEELREQKGGAADEGGRQDHRNPADSGASLPRRRDWQLTATITAEDRNFLDLLATEGTRTRFHIKSLSQPFPGCQATHRNSPEKGRSWLSTTLDGLAKSPLYCVAAGREMLAGPYMRRRFRNITAPCY